MINEIIHILSSFFSFFSSQPISFEDISNNVKKLCAFFGLGGVGTFVVVFLVMRRLRSMIFRLIYTVIICVVLFVFVTRYVLPHLV